MLCKLTIPAMAAIFSASLYFSFPAVAKPATFTFDKGDGKVSFKAAGDPNSIASSAFTVTGEGAGAGGKLSIASGQAIEGHISFDLKTLKTGMSLRDKHMREKYLDVEKFPEAVFAPTSVPWSDPSLAAQQALKEAPFSGRLSLHGVEVPVKGTMTTEPQATGKLNCQFRFLIKLSDFKIMTPSFADIKLVDTVDVVVNSSVKVDVP